MNTLRTVDFVVLLGTLASILGYGLYRARGAQSTSQYLLAGKSMPWYAIALSIMATQASAITFISTTGQAYADGMRFVQFYFGLPIAMIIVSMTAVPIFHRSGVYTAYEYLEKRFDSKTRILVSILFLIQRGLGVGIALYAPSIVLAVILGWPEQYTILVMGCVAVAFTTLGGIKAVTWTDTQQMLVMTVGLVGAFSTAIYLLPGDIHFADALRLASAAGKLNPVTFVFDWNDRYNLFSGLIGGTFLALAYFGCDQSQVQRYLTGRSVTHSRMSLLFNAIAKIPMQFFILLTGCMVFVFYIFTAPPPVFDRVTLDKAAVQPGYAAAAQRYDAAVADRAAQARAYLRGGDHQAFLAAHQKMEAARGEVKQLSGSKAPDTNYIFLSFVTKYLPAGLVGLILAVIFGAAMSVASGEINSLATVTVIDLYKRFWNSEASDNHYLWASRLATLFWGLYAIGTANFGKGLGSLIEAVNMLGSLFYGGLLGVFVLAFYVPTVRATPAFLGVLLGEAAIFGCFWFTGISFLWYNVIGAVVVVASALLINVAGNAPSSR
ncbi:MAG: sodium:solute symporter [Verrucomicrobiota bacterium]